MTASAAQLLVAAPVALLAGLVSFASPCVLPLVPGYLGYLGGVDAGDESGETPHRRRMTLGVALFVLGFSAVFVVTGYLLGEAGFLLIRWRDPLTRVSGVFVILLGLAFVGQIGVLQRTLKPRWMPAPGLVGAPLLGGVFAVGWTPCLGPTLAAINTLALQSGRAGQGAILATVYSVGLGLPFVVLAFGFGWATSAVRFLRQRVRAINLIGGAVLVTIGILMVSGVWLALTSELQARWASFVPAL